MSCGDSKEHNANAANISEVAQETTEDAKTKLQQAIADKLGIDVSQVANLNEAQIEAALAEVNSRLETTLAQQLANPTPTDSTPVATAAPEPPNLNDAAINDAVEAVNREHTEKQLDAVDAKAQFARLQQEYLAANPETTTIVPTLSAELWAQAQIDKSDSAYTQADFDSLVQRNMQNSATPYRVVTPEAQEYARQQIGARLSDFAYRRSQYKSGITQREFADRFSAERVEEIKNPDGSETFIFAGQGTDGLPVYAVQERYTAADGEKETTRPVRFDTLEHARAYVRGEKAPYSGENFPSYLPYDVLTNKEAPTYIAVIRQAEGNSWENADYVADSYFNALRDSGRYDPETIDRWESEVSDALGSLSNIPSYSIEEGHGDEHQAAIEYVMQEIMGDDSVGSDIAYDLTCRVKHIF